MKTIHTMMMACGIAVSAVVAAPASAQQDMPSKVPVVFDKYHTYAEITQAMKDIAAAYPEIVTLKLIGKSLGGRDMWVAIVSGPKSKVGDETAKPAMWIDGAVHANEIQAAEAVLYTLWYSTKAYGVNKQLTQILDEKTLYLLPMVNPDSRDEWFKGPSTPHNHRHNIRLIDHDRDGEAGEDGPDDLDGDGMITQMWKADPEGQWTRDKDDPRIFKRVEPGKKGEWTYLGEEGIDNDHDGRINEDPPEGDDMNREWPAGWMPEYVQGGAGPYPFHAPEVRNIADFILAHPNIAAVQSYHNAGGMILRGPGAGFREDAYPFEDTRVYDEIQKTGEQMLPYYKSMVIYRDLYVVHGGFVNWTGETLGIFSLTNEMWNPGKYFQREVNDPSPDKEWLWRDKLAFGQLFTEYHEYDHPQYGKILLGGLNKWSSRSTPTFMLEEECHRNFAFTMYHVDQTPLLTIPKTEVKKLGEGVWSVTVEVKNERVIPTRSARARQEHIGSPDLFLCDVGGGKVVASDRLSSWIDTRGEPVLHEPGRVQVEAVPSRGRVIQRFIIAGGTKAKISYVAEKAKLVSMEVELK